MKVNRRQFLAGLGGSSIGLFASMHLGCASKRFPQKHNHIRLPNIVVMLADDMGYGDVQAMWNDSQLPTPNMNKLANEGLVFTDAHSPSAVCTPTRYGLLTGRYCWRTRLKSYVLGGYSPPLIEKERPTIASVLKKAGYTTGCIGKWHLGLEWPWLKAAEGRDRNDYGYIPQSDEIDYRKPFTHTPVDTGFDFSYILPGSLDMTPCLFVENRQVDEPHMVEMAGEGGIRFHRKGPASQGIRLEDILDRLTDKALGFIQDSSQTRQPFFLYFPLTAPHHPVAPHERYSGKSGQGVYGDFIIQVDDTIGRVMAKLQDCGIDDNTLVIVTSDNGPFMRVFDRVQAKDHLDDPNIQKYNKINHQPSGGWRGAKADIWEGGHRVPFIARWPNIAPRGQRVDATISLVDLLATFAELAGQPIDRKQTPDSYSFLKLLQGEKVHQRPPVVHHAINGTFSIRKGQYKLVFSNGSGGWDEPAGTPFEKPWRLFDIDSDPYEEYDLADQFPLIVEHLTVAMRRIAKGDVKELL